MNYTAALIKRLCALLVTMAGLGSCTAHMNGGPAPVTRMIVAGATDVTITSVRPATQVLRYRAPGTPATWYAELVQRLEAAGWTSVDRVTYAPLNRGFARATPLGVVVVWEWAYFSLDPMQPERAQIRVQRVIEVPWWRHLRRLMSVAKLTLDRGRDQSWGAHTWWIAGTFP